VVSENLDGVLPLSCVDFEGSCCDSCHDDADEGYDSLEIEARMDVWPFPYKIVAYSCCIKFAAVKAALAEMGVEGL
jgi:hypothetical protein